MSHLDQLLHVHDDGVHSEESSERVEAARGYLGHGSCQPAFQGAVVLQRLGGAPVAPLSGGFGVLDGLIVEDFEL
jgi:hypothetical protein